MGDVQRLEARELLVARARRSSPRRWRSRRWRRAAGRGWCRRSSACARRRCRARASARAASADRACSRSRRRCGWRRNSRRAPRGAGRRRGRAGSCRWPPPGCGCAPSARPASRACRRTGRCRPGWRGSGADSARRARRSAPAAARARRGARRRRGRGRSRSSRRDRSAPSVPTSAQAAWMQRAISRVESNRVPSQSNTIRSKRRVMAALRRIGAPAAAGRRPRAGAPRARPARRSRDGTKERRRACRNMRSKRVPGSAVPRASALLRAKSPYFGSPTTTWPASARWTRIWCVRPVLMVTSSRLKPGSAAKRSATRTRVIERRPSALSAATVRTRRVPSASRYLCRATSITLSFSGQAPATSAA